MGRRNHADRRTSVSRIRGELAASVRGRHALARPQVGVAEPTHAPFEKTIRACIEAGVCPWCGRGGWKNLAGHTNRSHDVDKFALKDLAGLSYSTPACSPEFSQAMADRMSDPAYQDQLARGREAWEAGAGRRKRRRMSAAGKEVQIAKLTTYAADHPEQRTAAARANGRRAKAARWGEGVTCRACGALFCPIGPRGKGRLVTTCSPECRREVRRQTARKSAATRRARNGAAG